MLDCHTRLVAAGSGTVAAGHFHCRGKLWIKGPSDPHSQSHLCVVVSFPLLPAAAASVLRTWVKPGRAGTQTHKWDEHTVHSPPGLGSCENAQLSPHQFLRTFSRLLSSCFLLFHDHTLLGGRRRSKKPMTHVAQSICVNLCGPKGKVGEPVLTAL